jgi:predicted transcriptional regulator
VAKLKGDLGPLERKIMEFIWKQEDDVSVRDVLGAPGARGLAYTTVMTVLDRLWRKGFLTRRRVARSYEYRAKRTREQHIANLVGQVIAESQDRHSVFLGFVRSVGPEDLDELQRVIRQVERERKKRR